ncbi:ABC transporter permease [Vibrio rumoiensis]|uniref:ABC transporter permease n=1 Tax=Vibrio rumoiensis TaxID=76258 RepID=UPI000B5C5A55|nr:ABC transporter permease [Vibrio rumoiensis]
MMSLSQKLSLSLLSLFVLTAILGPLVMNIDPNQQNLMSILVPPSAEHWLGTDQYGRSMLSRLTYALRLSLAMAVICVVTSAAIGCLLGMLAGWKGGWIDRGLSMLVNILLALPALVIVLLLAAMMPGSFAALYFAISLIQWVEYFQLSRTITRKVMANEAVQNSRLLGFNRWYLIRRHLWPELASPVATIASFGAANAILYMASLGFIYVGIQPPTSELGLMIVELFPYYSEAPWLLIQPIILIALLIMSFHLLTGSKR